MAVQPTPANNEADLFRQAASSSSPARMLYWQYSDNGIPPHIEGFFILSTGAEDNEGPHYFYLKHVGRASAKHGSTLGEKLNVKKALMEKARLHRATVEGGISSIEVALEIMRLKS